MRLPIESVFGCRPAAALLWLLPLTCAACTADVELFRSRERGLLAVAGSAGAKAASSPNVLIVPDSKVVDEDVNCAPGHYVGTFEGNYYSAVWSNGSMPLTIAATSSMGRPGLEFWLERIARQCRSDQEFCADFMVRGGKIRGNADPFSSGDASSGDPATDQALIAVRFEIDFGGELDCSRGRFIGRLQNGCYDFATVLFRFAGEALSNYDAASSSFTGGMWNVKEMPSANAVFPPDANIGGMGNWEASWADDSVSPPAADGGGLCDMQQP